MWDLHAASTHTLGARCVDTHLVQSGQCVERCPCGTALRTRDDGSKRKIVFNPNPREPPLPRGSPAWIPCPRPLCLGSSLALLGSSLARLLPPPEASLQGHCASILRRKSPSHVDPLPRHAGADGSSLVLAGVRGFASASRMRTHPETAAGIAGARRPRDPRALSPSRVAQDVQKAETVERRAPRCSAVPC